MRFNPEPVQQGAKMESIVLKPGPAAFVIKGAYDTAKDGGPLVSRNGNQLMKLLLACTDIEGKTGGVTAYILDSQPWKIHQLCVAIGNEGLYESGKIKPEDLIGKGGQCLIKTGQWNGEDKSEVDKFLTDYDKPKASKRDQKVVDSVFDNDGDMIPF